MTYFDILRRPDSVAAQNETGWTALRPDASRWINADIARGRRRQSPVCSLWM